ncbi:MAG: helix-turn-helix transcriptional regulator [Rhodothermales bacterium]|nr:helix-turn-helix transcriptional regulator [Rhodothermales bacterium]
MHDNLARAIRYHRKHAGLTRKDLSLLSGVSQTAIYDVEHGKPTVQLATVTALLDALNLELRLEGPMMQAFRKDEG